MHFKSFEIFPTSQDFKFSHSHDIKEDDTKIVLIKIEIKILQIKLNVLDIACNLNGSYCDFVAKQVMSLLHGLVVTSPDL